MTQPTTLGNLPSNQSLADILAVKIKEALVKTANRLDLYVSQTSPRQMWHHASPKKYSPTS